MQTKYGLFLNMIWFLLANNSIVLISTEMRNQQQFIYLHCILNVSLNSLLGDSFQ